ncbi:MAG: hypothetical protein AB2693_28390 [Candidatus Thiodiazotropha sp.]
MLQNAFSAPSPEWIDVFTHALLRKGKIVSRFCYHDPTFKVTKGQRVLKNGLPAPSPERMDEF